MMRVLLLAAALAAPVFVTSCGGHYGYAYGYRVYDPYYTDYHVWSPGEAGYYHQWIGETHHRDEDYRRLRPEEQRQYWQWRHSHGDDHHDQHPR